MSNPKYAPEEPICAIATALAPAALGIVRCSGKNCIELASKVFTRPKALMAASGNTLVYGWIINGETKIDEVMVSVYKRGEFTFRAFINGKADLTKAEAVQEIIDSHTSEGRNRAAGRLAGNLFEEIDSIKKLITDTLASIEVEIEYPEDEETIADSFDHADLNQAIERLTQLRDSWQGEKLYQDGARIVLCGRTNAGKSSLFNGILKEERAIVSDIEGTTRDWIESFVDFNGIPVRLFDTAGIRETDDVIEAHGVELTHSLSEEADVVLYLADSRYELDADDVEFLKNCRKPVVFVWNKCDLAEKTPELPAEFAERESCVKRQIKISAKKGSGFAELYAAVKELLVANVAGGGERPQTGIGSARQKAAVEEALECVQHSLIAADEDYALDAVVQDLEDALNFLGEITGEVTADDVLGSSFSRFCVGK